MSDVVLSVEAKLVDQMSGALKDIQAQMKALENATYTSLDKANKGFANAEKAVHQHATSFQSLKKAAKEGIGGVTASVEAMERGFLDGRGALEVFGNTLQAVFHGGGIAAITAAAAGFGLLLAKIREAQKNARDTSWFGDVNVISSTIEAVHKYDKAMDTAKNTQQALLNNSTFGGAIVANVYNSMGKEASKASKEMEELHGTSVEALEAVYGGADAAQKKLASLERAALAYNEAQKQIVIDEGKKGIISAQAELAKARAQSLSNVQSGSSEIMAMRAGHAAVLEEMDVEADIHKQKQIMIASLQERVEHQIALEKDREKKQELKSRLEDLKRGYDNEIEAIKAGAVQKKLTIASQNQEEKNLLDMQANEQAAKLYEALRQRERSAEIQHITEMEALQKQAIDSRLNNITDESIGEQAIHDEKFAYLLSKYKADDEAIALIKEQAAQDQIRITRNKVKAEIALEQERGNVALEVAGNIVQALKTVAPHNKAFFALEKELASAEVVFKTAMLVMSDAEVAPWKVPLDLALGASQGALVAAQSFTGYATGTLSAPGGMAWVGERGPELMEIPRGARIYSNTESENMRGGVGAHHYDMSGDIIIYASPGMSRDQARSLGQAAMEGKIVRQSRFRRDLEEMNYRRTPEI